MASYAGYMQMGSQPVAGRARAMHVCDSGRSVAAAHAAWQLDLAVAGNAEHDAKPATPIFTAVPDSTRTRRPRGTP